VILVVNAHLEVEGKKKKMKEKKSNIGVNSNKMKSYNNVVTMDCWSNKWKISHCHLIRSSIPNCSGNTVNNLDHLRWYRCTGVSL